METIREIRGEESSGSGPLRSQTPALVRGELIETRDLLSGEKRGDSRGPDRGGVKGAIAFWIGFDWIYVYRYQVVLEKESLIE